MIGLDTNLLVRYLAQDDAVQSPQSNRIIDRQLSLQEPGFISLATMIETVWVLGSRYKMTGAALRRSSSASSRPTRWLFKMSRKFFAP
jgi:predicted nucleic-acid-binding protein